MSARQVHLEKRLADFRVAGNLLLGQGVSALPTGALKLGRPEIDWRASGLRRPGLVALLRWPFLQTRLAMHVELPLAHAVVDRLLAYDRPLPESRLQLSPVEWGVWTFLIVGFLDQLSQTFWKTGPAGAAGAEHNARDFGPARRRREAQENDPATSAASRFDLVLDRVGPDPFDPADLGAIITCRWTLRAGSTVGTVRLWLPEPVINLILGTKQSLGKPAGKLEISRTKGLSSSWRAVAGYVAMHRGLSRLRAGGVLPLTDSRLTGTPLSPTGPITLRCAVLGSGQQFLLPVESVPGSSGQLVRLSGALAREMIPRDPLTPANHQTMNAGTPVPGGEKTASPAPEVGPLDVPVTLTVELGRVNLTLERLAGLQPGDLIELGRHSREPVELTSSGRLVARGELVLIDTELGVRVTHVFL
jgi:flagellar motor switch protein FliN/FliY